MRTSQAPIEELPVGQERPRPRDVLTLRDWGRRALELIGACSFAIAQPVFDVLGRNATFFVAQGAGLGGILVLVAILVLGFPVAVLIIERLLAFVSATAARAIHTFAIAFLVALAATPPIAKALRLPAPAWVALAVGVLVVATVAYARVARARQFLFWIGLSPIVIVGAFLFLTPVRELILPKTQLVDVGAARSPAPVVVLVLDELQLASLMRPDGNIDETRFPNFAKLAGRGTWYPNASTSGESTQWASPSLLTGKFITKEQTPFAQNYPANLFTFVKGSQPIYANEFVSRLCSPTDCERVGADPGVRALLIDAAVVYGHVTLPPETSAKMLPPLEGQWAGFAAAPDDPTDPQRDPAFREFIGWVKRDIRNDQVDRFHTMLGKIDEQNSPALWYMHVGIPHVPWRFLPNKQTYELVRKSVPGLNGETWIDSQAVVDHGLQRYLLQLRFTDVLLGEMVARLERSGLFDRTLFMVMSDHGVSFTKGKSRRIIDEANGAEMVPIPLFVKYPGQTAGRIDRRNAELVDVLPTILDVLGIDPGRALDGSSLRGPDPGRPTKRVFSRHTGERRYGPTIEGIGAASARIAAMFGPGGGPDDLYAFGPHRALVGTAPPPNVKSDPGVRARLENPQHLAAVDPTSGYIPAHITGSISGMAAEQPLAVAINGRIAGVGWTFQLKGKIRMAVLTSPRYFAPGRNTVEVYRIAPDASLARATVIP